MSRSFERKTLLAALGVAALACAFVAMTRLDAKVDPRTYDLKKKILGQSAAQWTAEWWQWFFSFPGAVHPEADTTGKFVSIGQRGPVWFLIGVITSPQTRTATIPSGKSLLMPVVNVDWDQLDPTTQTFAQMKTAAAKYIDGIDVTTIAVTVDGVPISGLSKMRVVSPAFEYTTPDDGIYQLLGAGFPGGVYKPAVSDGYWVFLKPFAAGSHVISVNAPSASQVFTYNLTVVDHDRP